LYVSEKEKIINNIERATIPNHEAGKINSTISTQVVNTFTCDIEKTSIVRCSA
jgi:hypothetical protein